MSVRAVLRELLRAGLSGVGGRTGEGSYACGSGFDAGGGPGQALAAVGAPELLVPTVRSRSWYKARKTRAVKLSGDSWVAGMTGSGPVNGVLLCGAVP